MSKIDQHCSECGKVVARLEPKSTLLKGAVILCPTCYRLLIMLTKRESSGRDSYDTEGFGSLFGKFFK